MPTAYSSDRVLLHKQLATRLRGKQEERQVIARAKREAKKIAADIENTTDESSLAAARLGGPVTE